MSTTLARYFGARFLITFAAIFAGVFGLVMLVDYLEMMRRHADFPNASALLVAKASLYRVPQIVERILPFAVLIAAMSSFLTLSRRLEFVIARSAGMSAWQFTAPALMAALAVGAFATGVYNPVAARARRTIQAHGSRDHRPLAAGAGIDQHRHLAAPARRRRPVDHERRDQPRAGPVARHGHDIRVRSEQPLPGAHRGQVGAA